jgi:hypothetical protein
MIVNGVFCDVVFSLLVLYFRSDMYFMHGILFTCNVPRIWCTLYVFVSYCLVFEL